MDSYGVNARMRLKKTGYRSLAKRIHSLILYDDIYQFWTSPVCCQDIKNKKNILANNNDEHKI